MKACSRKKFYNETSCESKSKEWLGKPEKYSNSAHQTVTHASPQSLPLGSSTTSKLFFLLSYRCPSIDLLQGIEFAIQNKILRMPLISEKKDSRETSPFVLGSNPSDPIIFCKNSALTKSPSWNITGRKR